ncbi:MAG: hypothetical protein ACI39M_15915, partial [Streptomyces albidoflavus]
PRRGLIPRPSRVTATRPWRAPTAFLTPLGRPAMGERTWPLLLNALLRGEELSTADTAWAMGEIMVNLQAFDVSVALTGLLLSSLVTERRHVRERIEDACQELAEVVDTLAPGASGRRPRGAEGTGPEEGEGRGSTGAGWGAD